MSRIFHRPMFRKGGSAGGITSGLRQGYANGGDLEADPGTQPVEGITPQAQSAWEKVKSGVSTAGDFIKNYDYKDSR